MSDTPRPVTESRREKAIDDLSMAWPDGAVAILGWGRKQAEDAVDWVLHSIDYNALVADLERHKAFVAAWDEWRKRQGLKQFTTVDWYRLLEARDKLRTREGE